LRWWFRIAGGSIEDEKRLFGWAGEKSNQGLVRIFIFDKLQKEPFSKEFDNEGRVKQDSGINYIGFSLDQRFKKEQDKPKRWYIKENQTFEIKISFHPKSTEDDIKKFFCALWLTFNLGNFGSRSRRGFGSVKIEKIEENGKDITNNCFGLNFVPSKNLKNWIGKNLETIKETLDPPSPRGDIPYLFDNFEIYEFKKGNNWQNLLNDAGQEYKEFRRRHKIDHRIIFGLPIVSVGEYRNLRRASFLVFKILEIGNNNYTLLFIIMKPNKHKFTFHPNIRNVNWNLLSDFVRNKTKIFP